MEKGKEGAKKGLLSRHRWHRLPLKPEEGKPAPHEVVALAFETITMEQTERYEALRSLWEDYGADATMYGGSPDRYTENGGEEDEANEAANAIETAHASVFKNKVVPTWCSVEGDYKTQKNTRAANLFVEGVIADSQLHARAMPRAGLEALVCGTGILEVTHEIIPPKEKGAKPEARLKIISPTVLDFFVDSFEARDNDPLSIYRVKPMDRFEALEIFGCDDENLYGDAASRAEKILSAPCIGEDETVLSFDRRHTENSGDMILVFECWRKNARHFIGIENCTFVYEDWNRGWPCVELTPMPPPGGFWGLSVLGRMMPLQNNLDELTAKIHDAHKLLGQPKIIIKPTSNMPKLHLTDSMGAVLVTDQEPKEWNPVPITPDAYRERDGIPQRMRNLIGQSQFAASGTIPAQLREVSGRAIESWQDSDSARGAMQHRSYEGAMERLGLVILEHGKWLVERGYNVTVMAYEGKRLKEVTLNEIEIDIRKGRMKCFPISQLAHSYTAKMNELDRLLKNKAITMSTYRRMSDNPDIEAQNEFDLSDEEIIFKVLSSIMESKTTVEPLAFDNHEKIVELGTKFFNMVRADGADPEALVAIETYITKAAALIEKKAAAMAPPQQSGGAMGTPGMPPGGPAMMQPPSIPMGGPGVPQPPVDPSMMGQ